MSHRLDYSHRSFQISPLGEVYLVTAERRYLGILSRRNLRRRAKQMHIAVLTRVKRWKSPTRWTLPTT